MGAERYAERAQQIHDALLVAHEHIEVDDESRGFQL